VWQCDEATALFHGTMCAMLCLTRVCNRRRRVSFVASAVERRWTRATATTRAPPLRLLHLRS
jgi:hypothetical protein